MISNAYLDAYSMYCVYLPHMLAYSQEREERRNEKKTKQSNNTHKKRRVNQYLDLYHVNTHAKRLLAILVWIGQSFFSKVITSLKQKPKCFQYIPFTDR